MRLFIAGNRGDVQYGSIYCTDGDWIRAATTLYNAKKGGDGQRVLLADSYHGGHGAGQGTPFGRHRLTFARYSEDGLRYITDEPVTLYVTQEVETVGAR